MSHGSLTRVIYSQRHLHRLTWRPRKRWWLKSSSIQFMSIRFVDQVQSAIVELSQLCSACFQRYALQCSDDGKFAQLIFAADLIRAYRSRSNETFPTIISEHFVSFEEQCGTFGKTLMFFLRHAFDDRNFRQMNFVDRRDFLRKLHEDLIELNCDEEFQRIEQIETEILVDHILNSLPREIFDRKGNYRRLLIELIKNHFDRLDDYLTYHQQLAFVTVGSSIDQSCLIDGILVPIANDDKLLPSFYSKTSLTIVFLDLSSNESSPTTIIDDDQRFFAFDTSIYRQFISKYLQNVDLIISTNFICSSFLFELHRHEISVIDTLDEKTFRFLLDVYQCLPCNRLILFDDETIDQQRTKLLDGHVLIDQRTYIYLSSNGKSFELKAKSFDHLQSFVSDRYQTLLTSVPTSTLILTTEKILINLLRLIKYLREQLKHSSTSSLTIATEIEYLRYVDQHAVRWRHFLSARRIYLDQHSNSTMNLRLPICLFREYLLNGIRFLDFIHKIDGVFNTKCRIKSDYIKLQQQ